LLGVTLLPLATVLATMTNMGRAPGGVVPWRLHSSQPSGKDPAFSFLGMLVIVPARYCGLSAGASA
jgi:hypothetical protein